MTLLKNYEKVVGPEVVYELQELALKLQGKKILHVNSTRFGGGVAEILNSMVPLMNALGIKADWEVIQGNPKFFQCTKEFHNALQGENHHPTDPDLLKAYEQVNRENLETLEPKLKEADIVVIHDPQPAALIERFKQRKNKWIWRCHIDLSNPNRHVWGYLSQYVKEFDASIFSLKNFVQSLPHPTYLIAPSIDPLTEKNMDLSDEEIQAVYSRFHLREHDPMILQVSRFDRFKDPLGVIQAFQLAKKFKPNLQLVLAGGGAPDDPEGEIVLKEVQDKAAADENIHILFLPADSHRTINALQRAATIVLQKSIKEGFGLTVTEALWKGKPVIGGNSGGIRLQIFNHHTGFLVNTPEGAALRIRYLLENLPLIEKMGVTGKNFVKEHFLITRNVRDYFSLILSIL